MRYWSRCLLLFSALTLGTTISAQAQWMPVVAKQKELTYRTDENGSKVVIQERRGTYKRSSTGSVMHTWTPIVDGQENGPSEAMFIDAMSGASYAIYHGSQKARLIRQRPVPILPKERNLAPDAIVGEQVVNGVACVGLRVMVNGQPTGDVGWVSVPNDLHVKAAFTLPGGQRIVRELYDIQFVEPDSAVFAIPQNYTIITQ